MEWFLAVILILGVVTLVGHGLWVLFAAVYRRLADFAEDKPPAPASRAIRPCPRCGLPLAGPDCRVCRWPLDEGVAPPRPAAALDALAAQIETLWRLKILDPEARAHFAQVLDGERRRLTPAPRAAPAAQAAPAPPPEEIIAAEVVAEPVAPGAAARDAREFASEHSVAERAAAYAARREQEPPPLMAQPAEPARSWADWLATFMEERNIRWGELVGGLLIVCGSIALVVSFWSAIAERPWLKFLVFGGVTAALFGVGFYSEHRWRLKTTSQGLLSIACLLVPLNFLAIAAFSSGPDSGGLWTVVGELCSAALFAALVFFAGRVLVPRDEISLAVGVLVPSLAQLLVRRFIDPASGTSTLVALAALPAVCYLAVNLWTLRRAANLAQLDEPQSNALLRFLGLTSFAVLLPIALVLYKSGDPVGTLRQLPALAGLIGLVPLCAGLTLWQKLAAGPLAALRTAGTSVAVAGALVTLVGLVAGWPEPGAMLPAALVDFAIFTFVAWRFGMPAAHLAAAPCLALASLLGAHLASGRIELSANDPWTLAHALVSGVSGVLLAPLVLAYLGAAFVAWRRDSRNAAAFAAVAISLAAVSVALVSWFGFALDGDPLGAAWVYLLYAVCFLTVAARHRHPALAWTGSALLLAATVQAVVYHYRDSLGLEHPYVTALLGFCTLMAGIAAGTRAVRALAADSPLAQVAWRASYWVSLAAAAWLVWLVPGEAVGFEALHWAWLAGVWLAVALATSWLPVWTMFQTALVLATVFATSAQLHETQWFADSPRPWLDPWTISAVAVALVGLNLCWAAARIACQTLAAHAAPESRSVAADRLLALRWLSVDRLTTGALVAVLVALGIYAAAPGALVELSPRNTAAATSVEHFQLLGIPHAHAGGWGSWVLLAGLLVLLAAILRHKMSASWLACVFITASAGAPLVASRFENETAVASALVWCSAGMLAAGSAAIWTRHRIARQAARLGWPPTTGQPRIATDMTALVFALALIAPAAIAATITIGALARTGQLSALASDGFVVAIVCIVTLTVGAALAAGSQQLAAHGIGAKRHNRVAAAVALVLGTAPLVALVVYHVGRALVESPIRGPDPSSIFYRIGPHVSYAAPILVTALVLVGYALRERSSAFALAGGLVTNAGATVAWLLATAAGGLAFDAAMWLRLAQLNAAVAAAYTLAWAGLAAWDRRRTGRTEPLALDFPCSVQAGIGPAITALALGWAWAQLVQYPEGVGGAYPVPLELADAWGWLSFALVSASVCAVAWAARRKLGVLIASAFLVAIAVFAAGIASRWDVANWLAYNTLFVGHAAIAAMLVAAGWYARGVPVGSENINAEQALAAPRGAAWSVVQAAAVVLLALRELPENIWWTAGGLAYVGAVIAPLLAWIYQRRRYLYVAAPLLVVAGLMALVELNWLDGPAEFVYWLAILLAVGVPAWLVIELRAIRGRAFQPLVDAPPMHRVATRLVIAVLALVVGAGLWRDWIGLYDPPPRFALDWLAVGAALVAALACLWDAKGRDSVAMLYALGLVACGLLVGGFDLAAPWLLWTGTMVLAAYTLATSYLWSRRRGLAAIAAALGVPLAPQTELAALGWLVPANLALVSAVVLMTFAVELTSGDATLRVLAAQATLVQVVSLALLARGDRRGVLQLGALKLGAVGTVMLGWSWLEVGTTLTWLHALVVVSAATAGVAALYGLGLSKLLRDTSDWLAPARRITPWLAGISAAAIVATLVIELVQFNSSGAVDIAPLAILVVALTLAAMSAAALAAAVLPGRDPLSLSERGRTIYVYAAEILLALLFVHVRVTMPWLFRGFFQQFWPLIVMAIAYLGVGFAELCRRRNLRVLAEPLENTGALLPVLPVLGYWAIDSRVDYSLLLLCVGVLYTGLSLARRSFGFGVLAALAANGGLWFFLGRQDGLALLEHPQVWLIPPAVCVLAAAYLNRRQLSEAQMTAIRYFSSMAIYLSSTADIFVNGVAEAPWLPLVLAGLSILGILGGIVLRVRAFLFLGTSFLALALFTIIWHAAVDLEQTWIWYASVIIVGLLILATFAMFEKKRQEVLEVFERIKQWEA
jgi:hypothetical protein